MVFTFPPGHSGSDGRSDSPSLSEMPKASPVSLRVLGEEEDEDEDEYTMVQRQRSHRRPLPLHQVAQALAACPLHSQHFTA